MLRRIEFESRDAATTLAVGLRFRTVKKLPGSYNLTPRETAVLTEITKGLSDMEIAESLGITRFTVNKHIGSILIKTNTRSRTGAAVRASGSTWSTSGRVTHLVAGNSDAGGVSRFVVL